MKITMVTLQWYRQRVQPKWADSLCAKESRISIDAVINSQSGGDSRDKDFVAHNLISLCKMTRKRRGLYKFLRECQNEPGTICNPKRRAAYAKKWADKLEKINCGKLFILGFTKKFKDGTLQVFILGDPSKPMTYNEVCNFRDAHNQYRNDGYYEFLEIEPQNYC